MPPDLSDALSRPGAGDAFDRVVDRFIAGVTKDDPIEMLEMARLFDQLMRILAPEARDPRHSRFHDPLIRLIRTAAMDRVRKESGIDHLS